MCRQRIANPSLYPLHIALPQKSKQTVQDRTRKKIEDVVKAMLNDTPNGLARRSMQGRGPSVSPRSKQSLPKGIEVKERVN